MSNDETITVPRSLLAHLFDVAVGSMDFGSGFLDQEQQETLISVALLLGVDPLTTAVQRNNKCAYRGRWHNSSTPIHEMSVWYVPKRGQDKRERRHCTDCYQEEIRKAST